MSHQHIAALLVAAINHPLSSKADGWDIQVQCQQYAETCIEYLKSNGSNPAWIAIQFGFRDPNAMDWDYLQAQLAARILHLYQVGRSFGQGVSHEL
jgi:hypothetical protein